MALRSTATRKAASAPLARPILPDLSPAPPPAAPPCTNPTPATSKINYVHIVGMYLGATGANSKVVDLTSIGHSIIESNNLALGTGGTSYGIFGDTSTGGFDGTNTLIRHNNIGLNSTGDTCVSLAGVYNAIVIEQNVCTLAPASSFGYVFKKDSSGNYPDNDEIYGNDCETSSTAFGQVCYNIIGALSITFGPNNRCEKVYNCLQFPSDGSANGIHVLDPYLSLSNTTQIHAQRALHRHDRDRQQRAQLAALDALRHERSRRRQSHRQFRIRRLAEFHVALLLGRRFRHEHQSGRQRNLSARNQRGRESRNRYVHAGNLRTCASATAPPPASASTPPACRWIRRASTR